MSKRSDFLKGKGVKYWISISPNEFQELRSNEWQLRAAVTSMASAANKRLRGFRDRGIITPATSYIEKKFDAKKISTKNMSKNKLLSTYFELKGFFESETSSLPGWERVKNKVVETMEGEGISLSDVDYEDYWAAYDAIEQMNKNRIKRKIPGASVFNREMRYIVLDYVREKLIENPARSPKSIARSLFRKNEKGQSKLTQLYETMESDNRAIEDRFSTSRYL